MATARTHVEQAPRSAASGAAKPSAAAAGVRAPASGAAKPSPAAARPVAVGLAGKAGELATLVVLALVVPRALGPAGYGAFALALTLVTLATLALTLGGPTVLARFVPAAAAHERAALARALTIRFARARAATLAAIAAVAIVLGAAGLPPVAGHVLPVALVLGAVTASVAAALVLQAGLGLGRPGPWSARFAVQNALTIGLALVLHARWGGDGAIAGIALGALATLAWALLASRPARASSPPEAARDPAPRLEDALRFGAWQAAAGVATQLAHRGAIVAVAIGASSTETGHAALAIGLALAAVYAIVHIFTLALASPPTWPESSRITLMEKSGHAEQLRALAWRATAVAALASTAGAVAAPIAVPAIFGAGYEGAATGVAIAAGLIPLAPVAALGVQLAALALRPRAALAAGLAGAIATAVTAAATVPAHGAAGGAAATVAGGAATAFAWALLLPPIDRRLLATALAAAAAAVAAGVAA